MSSIHQIIHIFVLLLLYIITVVIHPVISANALLDNVKVLSGANGDYTWKRCQHLGIHSTNDKLPAIHAPVNNDNIMYNLHLYTCNSFHPIISADCSSARCKNSDQMVVAVDAVKTSQNGSPPIKHTEFCVCVCPSNNARSRGRRHERAAEERHLNHRERSKLADRSSRRFRRMQK